MSDICWWCFAFFVLLLLLPFFLLYLFFVVIISWSTAVAGTNHPTNQPTKHQKKNNQTSPPLLPTKKEQIPPKMKSFLLTSLLSPLLTYAASPANPFSNYFLIGFADNGPLIRSVTTVLVLPPIDQNQTGFLKVYPELATAFDKGGSVTGTGIALLDDR